MLERTTAATADCRGLRLNIALNYGGRAEIVDAARKIAAEAAREAGFPTSTRTTSPSGSTRTGCPIPTC